MYIFLISVLINNSRENENVQLFPSKLVLYPYFGDILTLGENFTRVYNFLDLGFLFSVKNTHEHNGYSTDLNFFCGAVYY